MPHQVTAEKMPAILTPHEIAARYGVDHPVVYDWILRGMYVPIEMGRRTKIRLKATRTGGRWKISAADLEVFVNAVAAVYVARPIADTSPAPGAKRARKYMTAEAEAAQLLGLVPRA